MEIGVENVLFLLMLPEETNMIGRKARVEILKKSGHSSGNIRASR